ncbi:MAG TPA: ankyrin repeat domain-containing protein [Candidatus Kapabacteria bacterium]|jgi:ankyrin repeat protein|nr:ankyrin repeat domain-containing protein [Candidatus Kapabacteria bacterium]
MRAKLFTQNAAIIVSLVLLASAAHAQNIWSDALHGNVKQMKADLQTDPSLLMSHQDPAGGPVPLDLAILSGEPAAVKFLLDAGANANYTSTVWSKDNTWQDARSPLAQAALWAVWTPGTGDSLNPTKMYMIAQQLIAHGAQIDAPSGTWKSSPLFYVLRFEVPNRFLAADRLAELLITNGAQVNVPDGQEPAMALVAKSGDFRMAELLLKHGANVNARNADGDTPLAIARMQKQPQIEKILLKAGAGM